MVRRVSAYVHAFTDTSFLEPALASVVTQESDFGFEVVVAVSDESYEIPSRILRIAADRSVPMSLVHAPKAPSGLVYSQALKSAKRDVIAILDDDDIWEPGKILRIERVFGSDESVTFFHNGSSLIDRTGRFLSPLSLHRLMRHPSLLRPSGHSYTFDPRSLSDFNRLVKYEPDFVNSCIAISKSALDRFSAPLAAVTGGEDSFLFFCGLASGGAVYVTSDRLTRYRIHGRGATRARAQSPRPDAKALAFRQFVEDRHLSQSRTLMRWLPADAPRHYRAWLERQDAIWSTLYKVAGGIPARAPSWFGFRQMLSNDRINPSIRDFEFLTLSVLARSAPRVASTLFLLSRELN